MQFSVAGKPWAPIQHPHLGLETLWTDEDLVPGERYYYRVRALTSAGWGEWSSIVCREPNARSKRLLRGCLWAAVGLAVFLGLIWVLLILSVVFPR